MRSNKFYRTLLTTLPLCLLLLAGCGNSDNQASSHSSPTEPGPKATPTTQQPTPTHQPATPTPTSQHQVQPPNHKIPVPPSPTVNSAGIQLTLDKASYSIYDPIAVTVKSIRSDSIYITTSGTSCTIFQLEMLVNGNWVPQGRCFNVRANPLVQLAAGETINQQLKPQNASGPTQRAISTSWHAGTYRISLNYNGSVDPDTVGGAPSVTSATFTIT